MAHTSIDPLGIAEATADLYRLLKRRHRDEAGETEHELRMARTTFHGEQTASNGVHTRFHGVHEETHYKSRHTSEPPDNKGAA